MKILHVQWSVLGTADIEEAFLAEGYDVVRFPFQKIRMWFIIKK